MVIAAKIRSLAPEVDISEVMEAVEDLLDSSISVAEYEIVDPAESGKAPLVDLSKVDFEALKARFDQGRKRMEVEKLKNSIQRKLRELLLLNRSRMDYLEKFQEMIEEYNSGTSSMEAIFTQLLAFAQELNDEEKRHIAEQLTEEELAVFDLLTKPEIALSSREVRQVKKIARELLDTLKGEKLVLDWRKKLQARADVRVSIAMILEWLPKAYAPDLYQQKCDAAYQHIFDSYFGPGQSIYGRAA